MIEGLTLKNFTVFDYLELEFSSNINIFIGENGTGKTHLLKLMYSFQSAQRKSDELSFLDPALEKLQKVFFASGGDLTKLTRRERGVTCEPVTYAIRVDGYSFLRNLTALEKDDDEAAKKYINTYYKPSVYIPVKEMLANAPGFRSLYDEREVHFEEVYADIIGKAFLPPKKQLDEEYNKLLTPLSIAIKGEVKKKGETFFLLEKAGEVEFTLVAEGIRKLALLWLLIRNGSLSPGATLYWDEPETNLNPSMLPVLVDVLLQLSKLGVQIFIATHSYPLLKEFDLQRKEQRVAFFDLHFNEEEKVRATRTDKYTQLQPNKIAQEYTRIYDLEVRRALGKADE